MTWLRTHGWLLAVSGVAVVTAIVAGRELTRCSVLARRADAARRRGDREAACMALYEAQERECGWAPAGRCG